MENHNTENKENIIKSLTSRFKLFFKNIGRGVIDFKNNDFFKNHIVLWLLVFNLLVSLINWTVIAIFINKTEGNIILHYNVYFGVDNVGNWKETFILPIIGDILFFINFLLAMFFYQRKERIASYVLLLASLMAGISLIIAGISVILINY